MRRAQTPTTAQAFEDFRADYQAAKTSRFRRNRTGLALSGSGADYHYRSESDYLRLMEQARDFDRNDALVGQTVDRAVVNTIQNGFRLDAMTPDDKLNADLEARWESWATDPDQCDVAGEQAFAAMEFLTLRHMIVDGDIIVLPTAEGALQLVEAHRLRTPSGTKKNVVHGVLLDERRRRLEYWLTRDDIDPMTAVRLVSEIKPYPVRDDEGQRQVFHVYNPKRVTQTRGVTAFAPIFDTAGMFEDINFAKLVQQQVVSSFAIFREREIGAPSLTRSAAKGEQTTETLSDGSTRLVEGIGPGMEIEGRPGEKLHGFSPNVPNAEFFSHVKLMLQIVGVNLGMPLIMVLLDASETNFSGWRGAMDQARLGFQWNQQALIRRFHRPCYLWKLRQWIAEDAAIRSALARLSKGLYAHRWSAPNWPYIEPLKDAQADSMRISRLLTSPRRLHGERGRDYPEVAREIVEDNGSMIEQAAARADAINAKFPSAAVTWRDVVFLTNEPAEAVSASSARRDGEEGTPDA
jgi:lambda family phage portal protein